MRLREIVDFVLHLRPHYQLFILSGGFLAGGLLKTDLQPERFIIQFFNVHLLLFGGATAYNSYWDKDEGPIGGLKNPPKMTRWMHPVSLIIQIAGLALGAWTVGPEFAAVWLISMLFFWLYSTPHARWKGHPRLSLLAIAVSTGTNSVFLGYLAAGGSTLPWFVLLAGVGVAFILLSMYPVSQIFQIEEDQRRGDRTFAVTHGVEGVRRFFARMFSLGVPLLAVAFFERAPWLGGSFVLVSAVSFMVVRGQLGSLTGSFEEYDSVMRLKYITSALFVVYLATSIVVLRSGLL